MNRKKLLIADDSEDFLQMLVPLLQEQYEVRCSHSGKQTLSLLSTFQPDLLVLELMIPDLDGLSLLQAAHVTNQMPNVLVISRFLTDYAISSLADLNVRYAIRKPCDLNATVSRITDLMSQSQPDSRRPDMTHQVLTLMHTLGLSPKHRGYGYLQVGILRMAQDPSQAITKEIYPAIASACGCTNEQAERSIRTAICAAWKRTDHALWAKIFELDPSLPPKRPTNAEFIARCLEALRKL